MIRHLQNQIWIPQMHYHPSALFRGAGWQLRCRSASEEAPRASHCCPRLCTAHPRRPHVYTRPGLEPPCVAATRFACARAFCALDGFFGWTPQRLMSTSGVMPMCVALSNTAQLYSRPKMVRRKATDDGLAFPGTLSGTRARSTVRTRRPRAAACMRVATPRAHPRIARAAESLHVPSGAGQQ